MSSHNHRLQSVLAKIKPFNELHKSHQTDINIWKKNYQHYKLFDENIDCDQILRDCLVTLGVPQLEPYLAWIPPDRLYDLDQLAEGGFAKVYKAEIYLHETGNDYHAAAKELETSMVTEVRLF